MAGANEQKLREHLSSSREWQVYTAETQWRDGAQALAEVEKAIEGARPLAKKNLGQHTADQADRAFVAMRDKVKERREQLTKGAAALGEAKAAINRARAVVNGFDSDGELSEPTPPDYSDDEIQQIQQMKVHNARMTSYNNALAAREEAAQAAIQDVDTTNHASTNVMREIQGKPPIDNGGGGGGGGTPGGGGSAPPAGGRTPYYEPPTDPPTNATFDPPTPPTDDGPPTYDPPTGGTVDPPTIDPPTYDPPSGEVPTGDDGSGNPTVLTTPPSGSFGGMAGALGGGLAGGAIGMGAIRAGALGGATPASGAKPIGSTARSGASGALGRGSAAGGTPTRGAAAARGGGAGAGRGSAGRGAGGRGARAAGAGAGAGAGGRGRKGKDEQSSQADHLHDDQDWIDDEDGAPGVID